MASKPKKIAAKPAAPSASRELVKVGKKDITVSKHGSKRDKDGRRPTTSRALVLRNGKHGSMGTGEIILASKMSGREKMDLLAEDYTDKFQKAIAPPFNLEKCLNIADAQYNAYLDEIVFLRDPDLFINKIMVEVGARTPPKNGKKQPPALNKPAFVAETVSTRIHNAYMVASAWKLVLDSLGELRIDGLGNRSAATDLRNDSDLRSRYLVLYDMVGKLVEIGQSKFSVLATTTPHYAQYFKPDAGAAPDEPDTAFDHSALKYACKSFLDSIVLELAFPEGAYSKRVLYQILHDAVDECPRESKRFPQELWNAVGDLSVTVELQELLEGPLLGVNATALKDEPREMPEEYEKWLDAQVISGEASKHIGNFQNLVNPLTKTRSKDGLDNVWRSINQNYKSVSGGEDIDTLWQLDGALERSPQWHSVYMPALAEEDEDSDGPPGLMAVKRKGGNKPNKKLLAITEGGDDESNDSMPELQSVSDSSDESSEQESDDDDSDDSDDGDEDSDAGYDTDEEDELREMMKEAMNAAMENPEFFDPRADPKDFEAFNEIAEERKGNPFLKLLGSLRGRVFNSNPKLKSTTRTAPRKGFPANKPAPPKAGTIPKKPTTTPAQTTPSQPKADPKSQKATVEEVEDEDAPTGVAKKKKKKKPKKKKKATADGDSNIAESPPISPTQSPVLARAQAVPSSPTPSPKKAPVPKSPPRPSTASSSTPTLAAQMSTISLGQTTVQSGHSYVKDLDTPKAKVKSRADHASIFSKESTEKKSGFFSKFRRKDQGPSDEPPPKKGSKYSWFAHLNKKSTKFMHQLLNTTEDETQGQASMKWDHFVQMMEGMGFTCEPCAAGSRVRFDPPSPKDPSVVFHKPHPENFIHPIKLKEYSKTLRNMYGWTSDDFMKASAFGK